jgi:Reverse transcriptase (RNA-dependent DNA polymerase).
MMHVDDLALAGSGPLFQKAKEELEKRFQFGSRKEKGEFLGVTISQAPDYSISFSMNAYAKNIKAVRIPECAKDSTLAHAGLIREMRGHSRRTELAG